MDRFSNLPNEISHHILSFLSFKDFTRVGCVSKTCRGLHLSSPSVNFCDFSDVNNVSSCEVWKSLLDSFDRYLNQRGDNKIRCFRVSWGVHYVQGIDGEKGVCYCLAGNSLLSSWIDIAVRCNVEVVQIICFSPGWFLELPSSLFHCESLKSLSLDVKGFIGEVTSSLSNLEYLKLSNIIVNEKFWKWVSDSCKSIKELHLDKVYGSKDIIIDNSSLESFRFIELQLLGGECYNLDISCDRLEKLFIKWIGQSNNSCKLSAPKLKLLNWFGNFASHQHFGKLPCLQVADISSFVSEADHLALFDLLCTIDQVKVLILGESIFRAFLKERFVSLQLDGVGCLYLRNIILTDDLIPAMITVLRAMPNLKVLSFISISLAALCFDESYCSGFDTEFWKLQHLAVVDKLKEVTQDVYHGSNVLEFAKYVLEHGQKLEKMVICYLPSQHDDVVKIQSKIKSNVTIDFHQAEPSFNPYGA